MSPRAKDLTRACLQDRGDLHGLSQAGTPLPDVLFAGTMVFVKSENKAPCVCRNFSLGHQVRFSLVVLWLQMLQYFSKGLFFSSKATFQDSCRSVSERGHPRAEPCRGCLTFAVRAQPLP